MPTLGWGDAESNEGGSDAVHSPGDTQSEGSREAQTVGTGVYSHIDTPDDGDYVYSGPLNLCTEDDLFPVHTAPEGQDTGGAGGSDGTGESLRWTLDSGCTAAVGGEVAVQKYLAECSRNGIPLKSATGDTKLFRTPGGHIQSTTTEYLPVNIRGKPEYIAVATLTGHARSAPLLAGTHLLHHLEAQMSFRRGGGVELTGRGDGKDTKFREVCMKSGNGLYTASLLGF